MFFFGAAAGVLPEYRLVPDVPVVAGTAVVLSIMVTS
jgi:hypothetical protein